MCIVQAGVVLRVSVFWRCLVKTSSPSPSLRFSLGTPEKGRYRVSDYYADSIQIVFSAVFILPFDGAHQDTARVVKRNSQTMCKHFSPCGWHSDRYSLAVTITSLRSFLADLCPFHAFLQQSRHHTTNPMICPVASLGDRCWQILHTLQST